MLESTCSTDSVSRAPGRMSVVSGKMRGAASNRWQAAIRKGVISAEPKKAQKSRKLAIGSCADQTPPINSSSPGNGQDDKESGEGFRQRVHRLADRLADQHESELRQLHIENASLRKRCGLPAAAPEVSTLNGNSISLPALVEGSQMTEEDGEEEDELILAGQKGSAAEAASTKCSSGTEGEPESFGLHGKDESNIGVERLDSNNLSSVHMENGGDPLSDPVDRSVEAEALADPECKDSRQSENGDAVRQPSKKADVCLPGCIRDCQPAIQNGKKHPLSLHSDGAGEQVVSSLDTDLKDFIKSASVAVESEDNSSDDRSSDHSSKRLSFAQAEEDDTPRPLVSQSEEEESEREEFELRDYWRDPIRKTEFAQMARTTVMEDAKADRRFETNIEDVDLDKCIRRVISYPSSMHRVLWDMFGMMLILYDIILIPLEAFEPESNTFTDTMNWVTLLFWSMDMLSSFFVGYVDKGVTVLHPAKIAKNYVQTWFLVDVVVVGSDWAFMIVNSTQSNLGSLGRLLKILRAIRTLRLVRLLKLKKLIELINDYIDSEHIAIAVSVCRLVFMLLMSSHFIACCWYLIGNTSRRNNSPNWIDTSASNPKQLSYRYLTSMHWSLTQFTPASIDVQPQNTAERTFAIVVLIFALITFSSFLSTITSSMSQLHAMKEDTMKQFWLLRRFLKERQVPKVLALRIQRYVEYAWQNQSNTVQESNVRMLTLLSEQLRGELRSATTEPHLNTHPLFQLINTASNVLIQRLSITAIDWRLLADSDSVFFAGETASSMYNVVSGELQYMKGFDPRWVYKGQWICEPVLWTDWVHLGELRTFTECDLISIEANKFGETVRTNPMMQRLVKAYAERFVDQLNDLEVRVLSDVEDMFQHVVDGDEEDDLVEAEGFQVGTAKEKADPRISRYRQSAIARRSIMPIGPASCFSGSQALQGVSELGFQGCHSVNSCGSQTFSDRHSVASLEGMERDPALQEQAQSKKSLTGRLSISDALARLKERASLSGPQAAPTRTSEGTASASLQKSLAGPMAAARTSLRESLMSRQTVLFESEHGDTVTQPRESMRRSLTGSSLPLGST